ncbi:MAG TPA: TIGR03936 family radical SAM-associated protein, partial [bacterium]|nr:TIGR03936 family radical SAM-associated protein [bacterium]
AIKLYFMLGLPGEGQGEIDGICEIANRCLDIGRRYHRRPDVTVSTSTFIPKAHTPFQWERQISVEETQALQRELKKRLRRPGLYYRWHDARMSFLEGVFSRGGEELSSVIEAACAKGARFDGWDELFNFDIWLSSFSGAGIDPKGYLGTRAPDEPFAWDFLGAGPSREFLLKEREQAKNLLSTADCTSGECSRCGMCDFDEIKNRVAESCETRDTRPQTRDSRLGSQVFRYRLRYTKKGRAAFLGSIEALDALRRGIRQAGLPLLYSEGFHPRPRISAGPALPVGVESEAEFADAELRGEFDPGEIVARMAGRLPEGMEVVGASPLEVKAPSIEEAQLRVRYAAGFPGLDIDLNAACLRFARPGPLKYTRARGKKAVEVDVRDYVDELAVAEPGVLEICVRQISPPLKILEILGVVTGADEEALREARITKRAVEMKGAGAFGTGSNTKDSRCPTSL